MRLTSGGESGSRPHRLEPLQSVVVGINLKRYGHQIRSELCNGPDDGETLQLGGGIRFLGLLEGSRGAADDALFTFPDLSQDCAEAYGRRVRVQLEGQAEVGEGGDGAGSEEHFEAVEGVLAVRAPMKDRVLLG